MKSVVSMAEAGKPVIGICNGFQVVMEAGLLPGAMLRNTSLHYVCRYVNLRVETTESPLTDTCDAGDVLQVPIGHADGNFFADDSALEELERRGRVMLRYSAPSGELTEEANPNGSLNHIAGIMNTEGNVVGLMPHLDRCYQPELGTDHGLRLFQSLIASVS